jgi:hypothetical protein
LSITAIVHLLSRWNRENISMDRFIESFVSNLVFTINCLCELFPLYL